MKKNKISKNWITRQHKDLFVRQSKIQGYRSRSAFKLIEMNKKFKFITKKTNLIDLGCSPGGWSQVASKIITQGRILAVDINYMEEIKNVKFLKGDFSDIKIYEKICNYFDEKVDVIISDMAANTSGNKDLDSYRTGELCLEAMNLSKKIMRHDGILVCKTIHNIQHSEPFRMEIESVFQYDIISSH